jgi:AraC family transcriptional activator of pobA
LNNDEYLLSEFKKVLLRSTSDPIIDLDKKFLHKDNLFAQVFETIIDRLGNEIPPNKWSYYRIGLITEGSADYSCGLYKFSAKKNTLIIIPPSIVTSSYNWDPETKGYYILFNLDFFLQKHFPYQYLENKKILQPTIQPYMHLMQNQADSVEEIFKTIIEEKHSNNPLKNELVAIKILELLILCERLYGKVHQFDNSSAKTEVVRKFYSLVETNFTKEKTVGFYASKLHIHPNYLNSVIKMHTGLKAKESIQNRLLLETKYLLHSTELSIKEISSQLGFDDPNYLTVFFKRFEGMSPNTYRSSLL